MSGLQTLTWKIYLRQGQNPPSGELAPQKNNIFGYIWFISSKKSSTYNSKLQSTSSGTTSKGKGIFNNILLRLVIKFLKDGESKFPLLTKEGNKRGGLRMYYE